MCAFLVRRDAPKLSDDEALALSAHLNLGTGQFGTAGLGAIEEDVAKWVSRLLFSVLSPKLVVCFGLRGIALKTSFNALWNSGGLVIDWRNPDEVVQFDRYAFRLWYAKRQDGTRLPVLMWPNHPNRHPFSGPAESVNWRKAKRVLNRFLVKLDL